MKKLFLAACLLWASLVGAQVTHTVANKDGNNIFTNTNQFNIGLLPGPVSFANLTVTPSQTNGNLVFCSDCVVQDPCVGSGTGAFAMRIAGAWDCSTHGGGGGGGNVNAGTTNRLGKYVSSSNIGNSGVTDDGTTVSTSENISANQLTSTVSTGTAPLVVASTTVVSNLNVSQLLGQTWAIPGTIGGTTPGNATFANLTINGTCTGTACGVQFSPAADQTLLAGFNLVNSIGGGFQVTDTTETPSDASLTMSIRDGVGQGTLLYSEPAGSISTSIRFNSSGAIVFNPKSSGADDGGHGVVINNSGLYLAGAFTDSIALLVSAGNVAIGGSGPTGTPELTLGSTGVEGVIKLVPSSGGGSYTMRSPITGNTNSISLPDGSGTLALLNSPAFTGVPTAPTSGACSSTAQVATQAYVGSCGTGGGGGTWGSITGTLSNQTDLQTSLNGKVALTPSATQIIQPSTSAAIALQSKCPAGAAGTLACLQVLDNAGGNIISILQNDTVQVGTGTGGSITLTNVFGPNANPATAGQVAVSSTDNAVCWRNNANTGNLCLDKTSADIIRSAAAFAVKETVAGSGIAGYGVLYEDSTTHVPSWSANNGSFLVIPQETGAMTSGHLVSVNATTNLIQDSGLILANVLLGTPTNHATLAFGAAQTVTAIGPGTSGQCYLSNGAGADPGFAACPGGGSSALSSITAAVASNSINNGDNPQTWNWQGTTSGRIGFLITENAASTSAGTPVLFKVSALTTSTMNPVQFDFNGNGIRMNTSGQIASIGTGGILPTALTSVVGTGAAVLATSATGVTMDAEGASNVLTRPFYLEYEGACNSTVSGPGSFDLPTSAAPTTTCFGTTTTQGVIDFVDASTTTATGHFTLPQGWVGNMDARIFWFANASSANAVRWSVQTGCIADTEAFSTGPSYNTASQSNTAYTGTANQRKTTTLSAIAMTNCAAGETMYFQLSRIGGDAGDTLTATAEVVSVQFEGRSTK